jgi:phenylacetate-CoA ligase
MSQLRGVLIRTLFSYFGILSLYREVCETPVSHGKDAVRRELESLLKHTNQHSPYYAGKWTEFLENTNGVSDDEFLAAFSKLPVMQKKDYATAGFSILDSRYQGDTAPQQLNLAVPPLQLIEQVRQKDFLFALPTGGTTSLPLSVWMNKRHAFEMLFTFFKCWHENGWKLGEKVLVFYPKDVYNIDEMAAKNYLRLLTGFHIQLFETIDTNTVQTLVSEINTFKPHLMIVFPSTMNLVSHIIQREGLQLSHQPKCINVSGETFFDCQRRNIRRVFPESNVQDSYGSVELGEIAHEVNPKQLGVFSHLAYIENHPTEDGQYELVITRLKQTNFPFIRYKMGDVGYVQRANDTWQLTNIEGKDSNFLQASDGRRYRPSFFNQMVNALNASCSDCIVEIKVLENRKGNLVVYFVLSQNDQAEPVGEAARVYLSEHMGGSFTYDIQFVDAIAHDYRRKFRVIERAADEVEYAGGIVGNAEKMQRLNIS